MIIDDKIFYDNVNIEKTTKDYLVLNINGEQILQDLYDELKLELKEEDCDDYEMTLLFQDYPLIKIYPNEFFNEKDCKQLLIEIQNRFNDKFKTALRVME